jgi:hypothetical protein
MAVGSWPRVLSAETASDSNPHVGADGPRRTSAGGSWSEFSVLGTQHSISHVQQLTPQRRGTSAEACGTWHHARRRRQGPRPGQLGLPQRGLGASAGSSSSSSSSSRPRARESVDAAGMDDQRCWPGRR